MRIVLHRKKSELETEWTFHHAYILPVATAVKNVNHRIIRIKTAHGRSDAHIGATSHILVAWSNRDALRRQ